MTNFSEYRIIKSDGTPITLPVVDKTALHEDAASNKYIIEQASGYFKHVNPYVRLTTNDIEKVPGGDPLVPFIVQPWNTNTITTKVDADSEIKLDNLDDAIFKDGPNKKVTLQFVVYIPDNYTISADSQGNVTDLKGTTIRSKDLHGFTVTDNNSKNSHYRVQQADFGSFDVVDIDLYNLGTVEQHNSVNYNRAVIINVKATMQYNSTMKRDELGIRLWINNEDVSKMNSLPFFIISEAGTIDPTNSLVQDNDKYSKSEIDVELAKKVDETDYKVANGITVNDWKTKLGVPGNTLTGLTDTTLSTLSAGEVLTVKEKADGTKEWVNEAASAGGVSNPDYVKTIGEIYFRNNVSIVSGTHSSNTWEQLKINDGWKGVMYDGMTGSFTRTSGTSITLKSDNNTLQLSSGTYLIDANIYRSNESSSRKYYMFGIKATNSDIPTTTKYYGINDYNSHTIAGILPIATYSSYNSKSRTSVVETLNCTSTSDLTFWLYSNDSDTSRILRVRWSIIKIG